MSTPAPNPPMRSRRLRNVLLACVIAVAMYAVLGFLVAPPLVKKAIIDNAREKAGRVVTIDDLTFNPFTLAATAKGLRVMEPDGKTPFASFDQLDVDGSITSVYHLAPVADQVTLAGLKLNLVRETDTRYNVSDILTKIAALPPRPETGRVKFSLSNIRLTGARVDFEDKPKGAKHQVSDIDIAIPFISNLPGHLKEYVQPSFAAKVNGAALSLKGETLPFENSLRTHLAINLDALDVQRYVEYSPAPLPVKIDSGKLDANLSIRFTQAAGKDPSVDVAGALALRDLKVTAPDDGGSAQVARIDADIASLDPIAGLVKVNSVKVTDASAARGPVRLGAAELKDIHVDLKKKRVEIASLGANDAAIEIMRKRDGSIEMPVAVKVKDEGAPADAASPWVMTLARLTVDGYRVTVHDATVKPALAHHVNVAHLEAAALSTEKGAKSTMSAKLGLDKAGSVEVEGAFGLAPLEVNAKVDARHVDIVPARRYIEQFKTVALKSGFASAKGTFTLRGEGNAMQAGYNGTAALSNLATVDTTIGEDLLNWDAVRASGIAFKWAGEAPLDLAIAEVAVDKVYSRVVVNPDGKLNLQQLKAATPAEPEAPAPASEDKPRKIRIDRVVFTDSRLNFTDHFIKPNYTADVGGLAGTVTNLSSDPSTRGVVDLKGAYDQTSPVTIAGTVNPLSGNLFLDIAAKGKDIELPKLSAYSLRYAGYGITKGKLTLDVKYHVEDGKMQGRNRIFLDQLTFGEHVDNPEATKLPVLFAVNLLKNSKGEIDLELPVSGSLDDPQFAVGALVGQVVSNLLKKAVTAPFSLLTAAFGGTGGGAASPGGGDDLAYVDFEPGREDLDAGDRKKLDAVVKALLDRPAIKLEMAPRNDAEKDLLALKKAALRAKLKAADGAQYAALVKAEYLREAPPKAPAKDAPKDAQPREISAAEMEAFLLERIPVSDDDLRALDARRSDQVKAYLVGEGKLGADRVLIAAAAQPATEKAQSSRVDFTLK